MRVVQRHSHLGGEEFLLVHHPSLLDGVIGAVESAQCNASDAHADVSSTITSALHQRDWQSIVEGWRDSHATLIKDRVALQLGFGVDPTVHMAANHLLRFASDMIDVGIEVLPMESHDGQRQQESVSYKRELAKLIEGGRSTPVVPLVLLGTVPDEPYRLHSCWAT